MEIFQLLKKYYAIIGIDVVQSHRENPFNAKIVCSLLISILCAISTCIFCFYGANSLNERINSMELGAAFMIGGVCFMLNIKSTTKIIKLITSLQTMIEKRE